MAEVTWVDDKVCVCDNCGCFASDEEKIIHHKTCTPGESKKWEQFYEENKEEKAPTIEDHIVVKVIVANACFIKNTEQFEFEIKDLKSIKNILKLYEKTGEHNTSPYYDPDESVIGYNEKEYAIDLCSFAVKANNIHEAKTKALQKLMSKSFIPEIEGLELFE